MVNRIYTHNRGNRPEYKDLEGCLRLFSFSISEFGEQIDHLGEPDIN